jgi:hypothetical protein
MKLHLEDGFLVMSCQWIITILVLLALAYLLRWIFAEDGKHPTKEKIVKFLYQKHTIPVKVKLFTVAIIVILIFIAIIRG